jgi:DNA (cytosine-5)-methyltransferase 1
LEHHYPEVPVHGDFTTIGADQYGSIDLLVGGTPCQSFSIAGLRGGMDDDRGNLALEFIRLAQRKRPQWLVWENVPGVLSSNGGRDFGSFLGALAEIGYGFAYRVLDAQFFGVAQRRRRVFVVGYLGDWRRAAAVLFERESLSGNPAPSREKGEKVAPAVTTGPPFSRTGNERVECEAIVPEVRTVGALDTQCGLAQQAHQSFNPGHYVLEREAMGTITARMFNALGARDAEEGAILPAVGFTPQEHAVQSGLGVRRLTPTECERLQGFPDGFTQVPYRNRSADKCPDGPRYKAIGNSMAVPVMRWIGERIQQVEGIQ